MSNCTMNESKLDFMPGDKVELVINCTVEEVKLDSKGGFFVTLRATDGTTEYKSFIVDVNTARKALRKKNFDDFTGVFK